MSLLVTAPAQATTTTEAGITYEIDPANPGEARVTGYDPAVGGTDVAIPPGIEISGEIYPVATIWTGAFRDDGLTSVSLPDTLRIIGINAFRDNDLTTVVIPDSVTVVGWDSFRNNDLTTLTLGSQVAQIDMEAFRNNDLDSVTIPDSVISIGHHAFRDNGLTSVDLGSNVTYLGHQSFGGNDLITVTVPDSVETIDAEAFAFNRSLTSVDLGAGITTIGTQAFLFTGLTSVTIPAQVTSIGDRAFSLSSLTEVSFTGPAPTITPGDDFFATFGDPAGKTLYYPWAYDAVNVGAGGYTSPTWQAYTSVALGMPVIEVVGGITYRGDPDDVSAGATAIAYDGSLGPAITIPETVVLGGTAYEVTHIGDDVFLSHGLTSVSLPGTLLTIGDGAFGFNALTEITLGDSVTYIGDDAFAANALTSLVVPDSVVTLGVNSFGSNALTSVTLGTGLQTIEVASFTSNDLTSVTIPASVTSIGEQAFGFNALTEITLGDSVTHIGDYAFHRNALTSLVVPDSVVTLGEGAFSSNALTSVTLGSGLQTIHGYAFADNRLTSVTIPASVTSIGDQAFVDNPGLAEVHLSGPPPTVTPGTGALPSFDPAATTLSYPWALHESNEPGGYTSPIWQGYDAIARDIPVAFEVGAHGDPVTDAFVDYGQPVAEPPRPTADGWAFTGWHTGADLGTLYDFDTPVTEPLTLHGGWEAQVVTTLDLSASATEVAQGDSITIAVLAHDQFGTPVGDVTDQVTFTSSVPTDIIDANTITFPTASPHVITATHVDGATATTTITVTAATDEPPGTDPPASTPPGGTPDPPSGGTPGSASDAPGTPGTGALARTGAALAWSLLAIGLLAILSGLALLTLTRPVSHRRP